jgi:hypothetical protein
MQRNRYLYSLLLIAVILLGLASRHFAKILPSWVHLYLGDALWALMVFILFALVCHRKTSLWVALCALAFSFGIEISQLYHALWIDTIRANPLGGLVLGFGFLWSDLACYTVGIGWNFFFARNEIISIKYSVTNECI